MVATLKDVDKCVPCMAKWIVEGAEAHDAASGAPSAGPIAGSVAPPQNPRIDGWQEFVATARLSQHFAAVAEKEMRKLGVVDVKELTREDWEGLACWHFLLTFEQRRLLKCIP